MPKQNFLTIDETDERHGTFLPVGRKAIRYEVKRKVPEGERGMLIWACGEIIGLPEREIWPKIKSLIEANANVPLTEKTHSLFFGLATLALIAVLPGIGDDERKHVAEIVVGSKVNFKKTLKDIIYFAPECEAKVIARKKLALMQSKSKK